MRCRASLAVRNMLVSTSSDMNADRLYDGTAPLHEAGNRLGLDSARRRCRPMRPGVFCRRALVERTLAATDPRAE
jgi:hypothetical protein